MRVSENKAPQRLLKPSNLVSMLWITRNHKIFAGKGVGTLLLLDHYQVLFSKALELAADATVAYFNPDVSSREQEQLEVRLRNMETELEQLRQEGHNSDALNNTETILFSLRPTIESLDTRVSSLEDRVSLLEERLNVSQIYLPNLRREINYSNSYFLENVQPSFDCREASVTIEFSICNSPELSDIDGRMGKIYWDLRDSLPNYASEELLQEQLRWLRIRDSSCNPTDINCLMSVYRLRVIELSSRINRL